MTELPLGLAACTVWPGKFTHHDIIRKRFKDWFIHYQTTAVGRFQGLFRSLPTVTLLLPASWHKFHFFIQRFERKAAGDSNFKEAEKQEEIGTNHFPWHQGCWHWNGLCGRGFNKPEPPNCLSDITHPALTESRCTVSWVALTDRESHHQHRGPSPPVSCIPAC